ncbi:MAG: hydroxymethylbilane synthase [Pyrinomonadaceae bacterium]
MPQSLVIGSRGSRLALIQAGLVKTQLTRIDKFLDIRIEVIRTSGDVNKEPLSLIGGKGVFTKELEDALLDGRIDLAVHSLKDLPSNIPASLTLAAICEREDPWDALVLKAGVPAGTVSLSGLAQGAVVGTSSPRRLAQIKNLRPDIVVRELRGNVDTRLRKLDGGEYDALILACAGLRRLDLAHRISGTLFDMLPAIGQGALGIETRMDDARTTRTVGQLNHEPTQFACAAERSLLRALGGGCQLPIAGYATVRDQELTLEGLVADPRGDEIVRAQISGSTAEAETLGSHLALKLLEQGADKLLDR